MPGLKQGNILQHFCDWNVRLETSGTRESKSMKKSAAHRHCAKAYFLNCSKADINNLLRGRQLSAHRDQVKKGRFGMGSGDWKSNKEKGPKRRSGWECFEECDWRCQWQACCSGDVAVCPQTLVKLLKEVLYHLKVDTSLSIGNATDGASNMHGPYRGFSASGIADHVSQPCARMVLCTCPQSCAVRYHWNSDWEQIAVWSSQWHSADGQCSSGSHTREWTCGRRRTTTRDTGALLQLERHVGGPNTMPWRKYLDHLESLKTVCTLMCCPRCQPYRNRRQWKEIYARKPKNTTQVWDTQPSYSRYLSILCRCWSTCRREGWTSSLHMGWSSPHMTSSNRFPGCEGSCWRQQMKDSRSRMRRTRKGRLHSHRKE